MLVAAGCGRVDFDRMGDASSTSGDGAMTGDGPALNTGLVAWYKLDEGSGVAIVDSSGLGNDGWTTGCGFPFPTWTAGVVGEAMQFAAASSNCVQVNETPTLELAGSWTVSAWVDLSSVPPAGQAYAVVIKPNAASQHNYSLWADHGFVDGAAGGTGWAIAFTDPGGVEWFAEISTGLAIGTWVHVAGTWDGSTLALYVDGAIAATTVPGGVPSATAYLTGGTSLLGRNECCAQFLDGALDEVRIYDRPLDASEVTVLHSAP